MESKYRLYLGILETGDVLLIGGVFRELRAVGSRRELRFGERKVVKQAREWLRSRFALADEAGDDDIEAKLAST